MRTEVLNKFSFLKDFYFTTSFLQVRRCTTCHYSFITNILPQAHRISAAQCPRAIHSFGITMDASYLTSTEEALEHFKVDEQQGLSEQQVQSAIERYGRNGTVYHHPSN